MAAEHSTPEQQFLDALPLLDSVTASVCRRNACFGDEAEEFAAEVRLRLIDNDYGVFRKFRGKSKLSTYLTTVIHNLFRDYRISKWGKWRHSASANRMGELAVQLETLLVRDGYSLAESTEILRMRLSKPVSDAQVADIAARLPPRQPRRFEELSVLEDIGTSDGVERRLEDRDRRLTVERIEELLVPALSQLSGEQRLILKLRFLDGLTLKAIADLLKLPQRVLYSRCETTLLVVRRNLESDGLTAAEIRQVVGWERFDVKIQLVEPEARNPRDESV